MARSIGANALAGRGITSVADFYTDGTVLLWVPFTERSNRRIQG